MPPVAPAAPPDFDEACRKILAAAKEGKPDDFAKIWQESTDGLPPTATLFYDRLLAVSKKNKDMLASVTLVLAENLEALAQSGRHRELLKTIIEAGPHFGPLADLRKLAVKATTELHGHVPCFRDILEASGLASDKVPVETAIRRFNGLLRLTPGRVYSHNTFGEGVIRTLDLKAGKVVIDFATEKGRPFNFEGVKQFLTYRAPESFLALRAANAEKLREMAENDPVALVKLVLEGNNRSMKQSELKALLLNGLMTESQWTSWWARTRPLLRVDPYLDTDAKAGAHSTLSLRSKPRTLEEEVRELFFGAEDNPADRAAAIELLAKAAKQGQTVVPRELVEALLNEIARTARNHKTPEAQIQDAFLVADLLALDKGVVRPDSIPTVENLVEHLPDDYARIAALDPEDHAVRALTKAIIRDGDDAVAPFARALATMPAKVAAAAWKIFDQDPDDERRQQIAPALQSVLDNPLRNPDLFFWAMKTVLDDEPGGHLHEQFPPASFIPELLGTLEQLQLEGEGGPGSRDRERAGDAKSLAAKVKAFLAARKFEVICRAAEQMTVEQVNRLRKQLSNHPAFNESMRAEADRQLSMTRRDADVVAVQQAASAAAAKNPDVPANVPQELRPDNDVHWTTNAGRMAKFAELEELRTVKIPHNQAEIEKARAEGDLRENAGYTYAKEMQKVLMAQLAKMQRDIATARDYDASKVSLNSVGFGVRFTAFNIDENASETYTVFGKFEADADNSVISYHAPFAQQFLGRRIGDEFVVKRVDGREVRYRIETIENALAEE